MWFWPAWWNAPLARLFRCCPLPWHLLCCFSQPWRKAGRTPARHLPYWQLISRRWYGTSRASAAITAGGKLTNFTRCSCYRLVQRPTDQSRSLPRLLGFRPARRPVYPVDAATQLHLLLQGAHGLLRRLLRSFKALCRRREPAPRAPFLSAKAREPAR